jgi:uncharacterized protein YdaU (DUF1376 family)
VPKDTKPPYLPFYVDDFASDGLVEAMTTEEVGAYTLLLCKAWREEPVASIPDDDRVLARWARMSAECWAECRAAVLRPFKKRQDGRLYQRRMEREYQKAMERKRAKSSHGQKAANGRWEKELHAHAMPEHCPSNADAMPNDAISSSSSPSLSGTSDDDGKPAKIPKSTEPSVMVFPCVGDGPTEWHLTESKLAEWKQSFPNIDVMAQLVLARQWMLDNQRKTYRGMTKYLGGWLTRQQDQGSRNATSRPPQQPQQSSARRPANMQDINIAPARRCATEFTGDNPDGKNKSSPDPAS